MKDANFWSSLTDKRAIEALAGIDNDLLSRLASDQVLADAGAALRIAQLTDDPVLLDRLADHTDDGVREYVVENKSTGTDTLLRIVERRGEDRGLAARALLDPRVADLLGSEYLPTLRRHRGLLKEAVGVGVVKHKQLPVDNPELETTPAVVEFLAEVVSFPVLMYLAEAHPDAAAPVVRRRLAGFNPSPAPRGKKHTSGYNNLTDEHEKLAQIVFAAFLCQVEPPKGLRKDVPLLAWYADPSVDFGSVHASFVTEETKDTEHSQRRLAAALANVASGAHLDSIIDWAEQVPNWSLSRVANRNITSAQIRRLLDAGVALLLTEKMLEAGSFTDDELVRLFHDPSSQRWGHGRFSRWATQVLAPLQSDGKLALSGFWRRQLDRPEFRRKLFASADIELRELPVPDEYLWDAPSRQLLLTGAPLKVLRADVVKLTALLVGSLTHAELDVAMMLLASHDGTLGELAAAARALLRDVSVQRDGAIATTNTSTDGK